MIESYDMHIEDNIKEIIRGFFVEQVIQLSIAKPFKLSSDTSAPIYLDHRKIFSHVKLRTLVLEQWASMLKNNLLDYLAKDLDIVFAGTATAGITPAFALANFFKTGFVYVRQKAKEHGQKSVIEGYIPPNAYIIAVDDMVTTGKSLLGCVANLQQHGFSILSTTSISNHNLVQTMNLFQSNGLNLFSLFHTAKILKIACDMKLISTNELEAVEKWLTP